MKKIALLLAFSFASSSLTLFAQDNVKNDGNNVGIMTYTVTGKITDNTGKTGLELANVILVKKGDFTKQYVSYTAEDGSFSISDVPGGDYTLTVYYIGFKDFKKDVTISDLKNPFPLGIIALGENVTQLKEVVVTDFKKIIEQRPDGINYNVENDKSASGSSATEVLRKVPMVTVDMEGNVSLRGSSNIKVLIDGKPSELIASSAKDALRQIPSENIKSIEVITSPGAKYDGEGASGVINIITKKKITGGWSGTVFAGPSYNFDENLLNGHLGTSLNYRKGKLGINTSLGMGRWSMVLRSNGTRTDFLNQPNQTALLTNQEMSNVGYFGWGKLGMDYQIDSLQSFQASVNYNPGNWMQNIDLESNYASLGRHFDRTTKQNAPRNNYGINAAYSKKSKNKPGRTMDLLAAYSINKTDAGYTSDNYDVNTSSINYSEVSDNLKGDNELTLQADFVEPLKNKGQKFEYGLKAINRSINSDFTIKGKNPGDSDFSVIPNRSGELAYNQLVGAAYGQLTTPLAKRISMVAGARYEGTYINGNNYNNGGEFELPMFNNFLPNVIFMYDLGNFNKLKVSYNKRITRPSIDFVNPYIDYSDPMNLKQGNAELDPERTHNIELGYSTFVKRSSINVNLFHRITNNAIDRTTFVESNGVSMTTFGNISKANVTGADVFGGISLFRKLMLNINGSVYYKQLNSPTINMSNTGWEFTGNMYANYQINNNWSVNGFTMYRGNQVMLQGEQGGWYYYFLGAQRSILKGKAQIGVAAENFLTPRVKIPTRFQYENASQNITNYYSGRGVRVSFNWSFGKMRYEKEKTIKNEDLKKEDNGQMGGGMPAGGGR
ncbi:MAG TPA: TonB-dependent receptor [Edaphocola sp.]|nr:TonB-dependent receptor [Edaphocola sp.]